MEGGLGESNTLLKKFGRFVLKIIICLFVFIWARATLPRYRYDQLMRLGWKVFLPLSLLGVVAVAGVLVYMGWLPVTGGAVK